MSSYGIAVANRLYYPSGVNVAVVEGGAYPANQGPYLNAYVGKGSRPWGRGRPTLWRLMGGGYTVSARTGAALDSAGNANWDPDAGGNFELHLEWMWLERGGTVIEASVSIADFTSPYTKYVSNGKTTAGLQFPPGFTPSGAGFVPWMHPDVPTWYTDAIHSLQHVKRHHQLFESDPDNVWGMGGSATAHAAERAVYQEHAGLWGSPATDPQWGESTRVRGLILQHPLMRMDAINPATALQGFPQGAALASGNYTTPSGTFSAIPTAAQVGVEWKDVMSLLGTGGYGSEAMIRSTLLHISTGINSSASNVSDNTVLEPPFAGLLSTDPVHSVWPGSVLRRYVNSAPCRFVVGNAASADAIGVDLVYGDDATSSHDRAAALVADWADFITRYAFAPPPARVRPIPGVRGHSSRRLVHWNAP